jgi:acetate CoA/acetoacetate CoA-transferase alpha subunit
MKSIITPAAAAALVPDGAVLMIGGFMGVGSPERLIDALVLAGRKNLTVIANDTARPGVGIGKLIDARLVSKVIASHIGTNPETQKQMIAGEIEVDLVPQGSLAERVRAGGHGLGGVLTPTGLGTPAEDGKIKLDVEGITYLVEVALKADFALIAAKHADYNGNLDYALTARNFNPLMAMAGETVIAEAQEIVPLGTLSPDQIVTPHVLVDHLVGKERHHG